MALTVDLMLGFGVGVLAGWFIIPQPALIANLYNKMVRLVGE